MNFEEPTPVTESPGHIRCLGVVPVEIEELLKEIQKEMEVQE